MTNTDFEKGHCTTYTLLRNTEDIISFKNNKATYIMRILLDIASMATHKLRTGLFRIYSLLLHHYKEDENKQE